MTLGQLPPNFDPIVVNQPEYLEGEVAERRRNARGVLSWFELVAVGVLGVAAVVFVGSVVWAFFT